jgi:hypothetical protein
MKWQARGSGERRKNLDLEWISRRRKGSSAIGS